MKINHNLAILSFLLFLACNQNKTKTESTDNKNDTTKVSTTGPAEVESTSDRGDALAKMAPLTREEMLALLPEKIMGAERREPDVNGSLGTLTALAEYQLNDTTRLELVVVDCAGPAGVGIYNVQYVGMLDMEDEDEYEYTKTVDFKRGKAVENCSKNVVQCSLTWFVGRYLVSLDGNVPAGQLREIAEGLRF